MASRGDAAGDHHAARAAREEPEPRRRVYASGGYGYPPPQYERYERQLPPPHRPSEWPYRDVSEPSSSMRYAAGPPQGMAAPPARQASPPPPRAVGRQRTTPFLTEADRQAIMDRIRRGEKQADLAKEFNVSRAAITNLKQRRQMLEMLENSDSAKDRAEAQKRRRLSHYSTVPEPASPPTSSATTAATATAAAGAPPVRRNGGAVDADSDAGQSVDDANSDADHQNHNRLPNLREVRAHTTSRLLATLLNPATSSALFAATLQRHTRLLLEEAIGWSYAQSPDAYKPFALAFGGDDARRCLLEYQQMEPSTPTATLDGIHTRAAGTNTELSLRLPTVAVGKSPLLVFFDVSEEEEGDGEEDGGEEERDGGSLPQFLLLLHALVFRGVPEHRIVVVMRVCDHRVAGRLAHRFPLLQLVTSRFVGEATASEDRQALAEFRQRLVGLAATVADAARK